MFEGIEVTGMPDTVLSRGRVVVEGDKFLERTGTGDFLKRALYSAALASGFRGRSMGRAVAGRTSRPNRRVRPDGTPGAPLTNLR
jgi:hypothetical protein